MTSTDTRDIGVIFRNVYKILPAAPTVQLLRVGVFDSSGTQVDSFGGGTGADLVAIKDGTTPAQKLAVDVNGKIGINNTTFTVTATDLDIRDLAYATDSVTARQGGDWNIKDITGTVSLPTGASTGALQTTGNNSLSSIDGKITACNTGSIAGTVTANLGTIADVATQTTLSALNTKVTTCNTGAVTISASLPAGTNAIGKLAANSGIDIGDVDVTSISAGSNLVGDVGIQDRTSGQSFRVISWTNDGSTTYVPMAVTAGLVTGMEYVGMTWYMRKCHVDTTGGVVSLKVSPGGATWNIGTVTTITNSVHVDDNSSSLTVDPNAGSVWQVQSNSANIATETTLSAINTKLGSLTVDVGTALPAGTNTIGGVVPIAAAAGGGTPYKLISAATTNATCPKASAGTVYAILGHNVNAAVRYIKFYNKASAPTVGTDTPVLVLPVPGATTGAGFTWSSPVGIAFSTGIAFAMTTGVADSDTGAVAANEIVLSMVYL